MGRDREPPGRGSNEGRPGEPTQDIVGTVVASGILPGQSGVVATRWSEDSAGPGRSRYGRSCRSTPARPEDDHASNTAAGQVLKWTSTSALGRRMVGSGLLAGRRTNIADLPLRRQEDSVGNYSNVRVIRRRPEIPSPARSGLKGMTLTLE